MLESKITPRFLADLAGVRTVSGVRLRVLSVTFWSCCLVPMMRNSVLEGFSASMFEDIQCEMAWKVELSVELAERKSVGSMAM